MTKEQKPSFLIAGLGSIGQRHLRNLTALGVEDIMLFDPDQDKLASPEFSRFTAVGDLDEALSRKPAAVVVASPTSFHMETALKAAGAGCHLFLEKPISHNLDGVAELQNLAWKNNITVLVGFQFRFHPSLRRIQSWVEEGKLGRIVSVHARWREYLPGWHPWEDYRKGYSARSDLGGGVTLTLCHPFDYLRMIFGEVSALYSNLGHFSSLEVDCDDASMTTLRFESGAVGTVYLDYVSRPPKHDMIVVGDKGTITWDNDEAFAVLHDGDSGKKERFDPTEGFERNTMFVDEVSHFLDCIVGKADPLCTLEDGIRVMEIVEAVKRSSEERREIEIVR